MLKSRLKDKIHMLILGELFWIGS